MIAVGGVGMASARAQPAGFAKVAEGRAAFTDSASWPEPCERHCKRWVRTFLLLAARDHRLQVRATDSRFRGVHEPKGAP
jgi:hypothetical protein